MKWFIGFLVLPLLLAGCKGGIDYEEKTIINTNQTVIYDETGKPVQVLSRNGLQYINVGEAPIDLLVDRGLIRLETGEVVKQP